MKKVIMSFVFILVAAASADLSYFQFKGGKLYDQNGVAVSPGSIAGGAVFMVGDPAAFIVDNGGQLSFDPASIGVPFATGELYVGPAFAGGTYSTGAISERPSTIIGETVYLIVDLNGGGLQAGDYIGIGTGAVVQDMAAVGAPAPTDPQTIVLGDITCNIQVGGLSGYPGFDLTVTSEHGTPSPAVGVHTFAEENSDVECSVDSVVTMGTTNYVCTGWTGTGDVPFTGSSNSTEQITLTQNSSITWNWEVSEYYLDSLVQGGGYGGQVSGWYDADTNLSLNATPLDGWLFMEWSGSITGDYTTASTNILMDGAKSIIAVFSDDADGDGILNSNEWAYGTLPRESDSDGDLINDYDEIFVYMTNPTDRYTDSDGLSDGEEILVYGTNPNLADSDFDGFNDDFEINTGYDPNLGSNSPDLLSSIQPAIEFHFYAATNVSYRIEATDSLTNPWTTIEDVIINEGTTVKRLYSIEGQPNRYFRAKRN